MPQTVTLAVGRGTRDMDHALATLRWLLAGVSAAAVIMGVASLAWVIRRGLRPLSALADSIEHVGTSNLGERVAADHTPQEMLPVVQRLNELLERVEAAVARERAFTADVAHELRTPLAGLSSVLEVSTSRPRESGEYQAAMNKCLRVTRGMQSVVENLLLLARADAGRLRSTGPCIALGTLLQECLEQHEQDAARRDLEVKLLVSPEASSTCTDDALLRMVLNNLLTNAIAYSDANGRVEIVIETHKPGEVSINVANKCSQLSPDLVSNVFDRFWRSDVARTEAGVHCGLGLSLSRKLVEILGGTISATVKDGVFTVNVSLPAATPTQSSPAACC